MHLLELHEEGSLARVLPSLSHMLRTALIHVDTFLAQFVVSCRALSGAVPAHHQLQTPAHSIISMINQVSCIPFPICSSLPMGSIYSTPR